MPNLCFSIGDTMDGIPTPVIDKNMAKRSREAEKAFLEFRREHRQWLSAYKAKDLQKINELAKSRDAKAKKAAMVSHRADKFFQGICGLWDMRYSR